MPRFIADEMLGSLARWLRIIGQDTMYMRDVDDDEIVDLGRKEGRVVLTRDKVLASRMGDLGFLIESDQLLNQMVQIVEEFSIELEGKSRCTMCNGTLEELGRENVIDLVPKGTLEQNSEFYRCRDCGKVYWKGAHWENIRKKMDRIREISDGNSSH